MSRIAYVNGRYVPLAEAAVHVEDRGFQFGDGVYDVAEVRGGRLVDEDRHLARLQRSLRELRLSAPMAMSAIGVVLREVVRRNRIRDGLVYIQVTRGTAPRDHAFPVPAVLPTVVVTARRTRPVVKARGETGIKVISVPETRWARVDIKTVSLLPNALARQAAVEAGANEAWFGGPDGLDPALAARASMTLALSALTLPHALARLVLVEQIYRCVSLIEHHPYHRE